MMKMRSVIEGWQVISRLQTNEQDVLSHRYAPISHMTRGDFCVYALSPQESNDSVVGYYV